MKYEPNNIRCCLKSEVRRLHPPPPDNVCIGLSAAQRHAQLWILPLAASLFDFSRRLAWIEAGGFL